MTGWGADPVKTAERKRALREVVKLRGQVAERDQRIVALEQKVRELLECSTQVSRNAGRHSDPDTGEYDYDTIVRGASWWPRRRARGTR